LPSRISQKIQNAAIIAQTAKIVAMIRRRKIERKIEDILGEDQFGFRRGQGTRNAIGMLRIKSERNLDHVNWTKLMQILKGTGID
jgi:hypothetical protein